MCKKWHRKNSCIFIPAIEKIDQNRNVIQVPTRELALQTSQVCKELAKHLKIQVIVSTGGTSLRDDIMKLHQLVHLLVCMLGRILDLSNKGICVLKDCTMLVMDEGLWLGILSGILTQTLLLLHMHRLE